MRVHFLVPLLRAAAVLIIKWLPYHILTELLEISGAEQKKEALKLHMPQKSLVPKGRITTWLVPPEVDYCSSC